MPRISQLQIPREASFKLRGEVTLFKYNAGVLTDQYVDEYDEYLKAMQTEGMKTSAKMPKVRGFLAHQLTWIDLQGDDDKDLPVEEALKILDWNELQELNEAINYDIAVRNSPTPPSEEKSSAG